MPGSERGNFLQQGQEGCQLVAHFAPVDDHVDGAFLEQEFGALEAFRQLLAHRLLDDARPGEADQRPRFGHDDVTDESAFAYANEARGISIHVGKSGSTLAQFRVTAPAGVRAWIANLAATGENTS